MTAIRLGRERLTAVSNGFADLISNTCGSEPAIPSGFLNGSVFGNDMSFPVCSPYWDVGEQSRRCPVRSFSGAHLARQRRDLQSPVCRSFASTSANVNYFASAVSRAFAFWTAALTAARNESLLAGACTLPDSVLRKETFLL